jgi:hypothetical protein
MNEHGSINFCLFNNVVKLYDAHCPLFPASAIRLISSVYCHPFTPAASRAAKQSYDVIKVEDFVSENKHRLKLGFMSVP